MKLFSLWFAALPIASVVATASASDLFVVNINNVSLSYRSASNPILQKLTLNILPNTRTAFTKAAPYSLPCDLNELAITHEITNINNFTLYPATRAQVMIDGDEKRLFPNVWGETSKHWPMNVALLPGQMAPLTYTFFSSNFVNYSPAPFGPNVPFSPNVPRKVAMITFPYLNASYQNPAEEDVIWNNAYVLWVKRVCP